MAVILLGLLFLALQPVIANAAVRIRSVKTGGVNRLLLTDIARYYGMTVQRSGDTTYLTSKYSRLVFIKDKREAVLNGVKVNLSHAPAEWQNEPLISEIDFRNLLDPVLRTAALPRRNVMTVLLDPGHGGNDEGAATRNSKEKEINLQVALRVAHLLRQNGLRVHMTRSDDRRLSLSDRVKAAQTHRADLFVSIHANAAATTSVSGIETFLLTPEGASSTYSSGIKTAPTAGNAFDRENARLAYELQKHTLQTTNAHDRGVKHADFAVLRNAPCPAILIELGFMTNAVEERNLTDPNYQNKLALGIARGIVAFRNVTRPK